MSTMIPAWVNGTLQPVEKLAAHKSGLRHKAVSVFVMAGDFILLQKRALEKYHTPGLWANTCCTHPAWDEDPSDCAKRRLDEELGITGLAVHHCGQVEYRAEVGTGLIEHELVEIFVASAPIDLELELNPSEVSETRWATKARLDAELLANPKAFTPWLHIYMAEHCDMIFAESSVTA